MQLFANSNIILNHIAKNDIIALTYSLKKCHDIDYVKNDNDKTLLLTALDYKNPTVIELILNNGADTNLCLKTYATPLIYFIKKYLNASLDYIDLRIILMLLRHGADPDIVVNGLQSPREMLRHLQYEIMGIYLTVNSPPLVNKNNDLITIGY